MSTIELQGISKHYGALKAVDQLDLQVAQGELVTILGPSGSGKTTLLTLIAGLLPPSSGRIILGGRDVTWLSAAQRNIGLVFQSYALFPHMSVFDNIAFPLKVRKQSRATIRQRVKDALQLVRLADFGDRRPSQLSGGQQQRVALARAFVFEPDILLLDEPLGALDRKLREEVQVELRQLQRSLGITTLLVTHDQEEALSLSDRIVVLNDGFVQQIGPPEDVYRAPSNGFVADFLGTANFFTGTLQQATEGWRMQLPQGEFVLSAEVQTQLQSHPELRPGASVRAMVRPERITLLPAGQATADDQSAGLSATVKDVIFVGQSLRYHLQLSGGEPVVAISTELRNRHSIGSAVTLTWQPDDIWLVPAS